MAILPPVFKQRYFSAAGLPLAGGKLYTYIAGTTTPQATYTDATEASANTNPIILDANGECSLFLGSSSYKVKLTDSADVEQWTTDNINQSSIQSMASADYVENLGIVCSTSSNALTINVKTSDGSVPAIGNSVKLGFRSSSLTSGLVSLVEISSPLAMTISAGSTLGHTSGVDLYVYVYAINYNGVAELAVSGTIYQENDVVSTTAEGAAGGADTLATIYSITARTNVPIRLIARLTSNQTVAGTWAAMPIEIQTGEESRRAEINTTQIANLAITTAKLADGAVTNAKKGAPNFVESSSSGSFSTSSTTYVDVTNMSVSFTTTGRMLEFGFNGVMGSATRIYDTSGFPAATRNGFVKLVNATSTSDMAGVKFGTDFASADDWIVYPGIGFFRHFEIVAAGTYTFKIQALVSSGSVLEITNLKLFVREL